MMLTTTKKDLKAIFAEKKEKIRKRKDYKPFDGTTDERIKIYH